MNEIKNEKSTSFLRGEINPLGDNIHVKSVW
jgi:hypothetical protein